MPLLHWLIIYIFISLNPYDKLVPWYYHCHCTDESREARRGLEPCSGPQSRCVAGWVSAGLWGQICNLTYYAEIHDFWKFHETYLLGLSCKLSFTREINLHQVNQVLFLLLLLFNSLTWSKFQHCSMSCGVFQCQWSTKASVGILKPCCWTSKGNKLKSAEGGLLCTPWRKTQWTFMSCNPLCSRPQHSWESRRPVTSLWEKTQVAVQEWLWRRMPGKCHGRHSRGR